MNSRCFALNCVDFVPFNFLRENSFTLPGLRPTLPGEGD